MKISYKGDYALKSILDLALHYDQELVTSSDLAKRIDAPIKFLEQILLDLRKGGFVESRRGNIGGYKLSRPPEKISVGQVVRHVDGPIEPIACLKDKYTDCTDIHQCVFRTIWNNVYHATANIIDQITFRQLCDQIHSKNDVVAYSI